MVDCVVAVGLGRCFVLVFKFDLSVLIVLFFELWLGFVIGARLLSL